MHASPILMQLQQIFSDKKFYFQKPSNLILVQIFENRII